MITLALAPALAVEVGVALPTDKVRPSFPAPAATAAVLDAARGEVESFQIVIRAEAAPVHVASATASALGAADVRVYRVGLIDVVTPSNTEGATGPWPDALIPAVDTIVDEPRNAFPFDVPAGESRALWVDVRVPADAVPGEYTGAIDLGDLGDVPVTLRVHDVALPATSSLPSAFGLGWDRACVAHEGSYTACGDAGVEAYHTLYAAFALDYRVTLSGVVYYGPDGDDWSRFDRVYGPLLDGTASTWSPGARLTSLQLMTSDPDATLAWSQHFASRGWDDVLFQYTCDEPPAGCGWPDIADRAAVAHAAGVRTLVTTDLAQLTEHDLLDVVDIAVPVVNYVDEKDGPNHRAEYDAFLARSGTSLWWYQSCMSHGCGGGATTDAYFTGWPSYMIDASGVQNRAMEWLSFRDDLGGELYFATDDQLANAWTDQFAYGGNGDGTLFYPGRPDVIGGTTDIPVASQRLACVRDGMEDYELLALLDARGGADADFARDVANRLFPKASGVAAVSGQALADARRSLLDRLAPLEPGPGETDTDEGPPPKGCGCASATGAPFWLAVIALVALRRRGLLLGLVACSPHVTPEPAPPPPANFPALPAPGTEGAAITGYSRFSPALGPADGPALDVFTGLDTDDCEPFTKVPPVELYLFDDLPYQGTAPWRWTLGPTLATGAQVQWCPTDVNSCVHLEVGAIEVTTFDASSRATGAWSGTAPDGTKLHGSFNARYCGRADLGH